jgi:hypothetical protein
MVSLMVQASSLVYAAPFTWTISGTADSGQWNGTDLAGRDYVMQISSNTPLFRNGSVGFGSTFNPTVTIDISGLGIKNHGFSFLTQEPSHKLFLFTAGGINGGNIGLPAGTLGSNEFDTEVYSLWGPVQATGSLDLRDSPFDVNPAFQLVDSGTATSQITVFTGTRTGQVPEVSSWVLLLLALATTALAARRTGKSSR